MRVMDWVEGAAINRDLLQFPTLKRSTFIVQQKAFCLKAQMNAKLRGASTKKDSSRPS
jgi:hypothetical protein